MIVADSHETRVRAAKILAEGGVVAFRTDTFYGLGADPFNRDALLSINRLKGRESKPILVVISDAEHAARFIAQRTPLFDALCARHWPGALTLVAAARASVPEELTAQTGTVGVRLPDDEAVRAFVRECGGALTATSANPAGETPARNAVEVEQFFHEGLALIVDGGEALSDSPSAVLDVAGNRARLIREGVVSRHAILQTLQSIGEELDVRE
ncbi:MAG TPA: L-threonylcarbamoyladenylate synthase [Pyrinomonadaceae bacterium]